MHFIERRNVIPSAQHFYQPISIRLLRQGNCRTHQQTRTRLGSVTATSAMNSMLHHLISLLSLQINQFIGVLALARKPKPYGDVIWCEKSQFETANVSCRWRAEVGNVHKRKRDLTTVRAKGSCL